MCQKHRGLTKIRTRRRAAGSTNGTEPIRPVLGRLREPFPLSRGGATPYRFKVNPLYNPTAHQHTKETP
ncbi:hypothetical protein DA301_07770 [Neisseria gonorrhoeae]|nr:hypothetical protein EGO84_05185 [Neisseria gonorrhoeae]ROU25143.1 hypothetical protein EGP18_05190 [Neisseria gonorrhoeae]ROU67374.1 hypothetical protein EGO76_04685 [Neisseria gonorrhoeae]ROV38094.1 hypothetical protein EGP32_04640 [Neisseria gonorrhoeae]